MKIEKITPQIAALYLGQKCDISPQPGLEVLTDMFDDEITAFNLGHLKPGNITITLHLRRLESITEEEATEVYRLAGWNTKIECRNDFIHGIDNIDIDSIDQIIGHPAVWLYLLSRGFDLFGLIDAGLAKEITT